ncbi:TonB-dependent receptor [Paraflavitalea sp. CAU 1676]|uniref:TonB-dependent receptor n=1 Tax=Paraflavitalea sp. CAU 1676 TaxID=3032598 RepID=UPI0023DCB2B0|nr:TonB-dependent receptor [Paraflavitalea sp. CAU 1676]MDF2186824.1 TonB-dependent receptor [Paraflavitalea sp. CAU 1676]
MNLTVAILLVSCLHVSAGVFSQSRVTLNMQSADIKKVLSAIEKKTDYRFLYNENLLAANQKVTINAVNEEVLSVVNRILEHTSLSYEVLNQKLVVLKKANTIILPAQVTGKVVDSTGAPMVGVSVRVKGSNVGTSTNAEGNFSLTVPDNAVLIFSSVGFEPQEVEVGTQTTINVTLQASRAALDQVVVVGYGTTRKRDLTGSVASVKGSDLAKQPVQTPTQAMQGRVAGVQVISSGQPNSQPVVRIRGTGTMLGGANPLYVVDGVITDDIRNINSADILTMDVLKDASAAAIYGTRAANGVLIITTKKGRTGKLVVSYDGSVGLREATSLVDMAGPNQYANYLNEASVYYGSGDSLVPASKLTGTQTDWFDAILRKGFQQNHNISLSGGTDKFTYFLSAGYLTEEGILEHNDFNRFTIRNNNEYKITSKLKLSTLISYSRYDIDNVDANNLNNAYRAAPYVPAKIGNRYGNTSAANNVANPLLSIEKRNENGIGNRFQSTFALEYKPVNWITLRSSMGVDLDFYKIRAYQYKYNSDTVTFLEGGGNQQQPTSSLTVTDADATRWIWDNTATLTKKFDKHNFTLLLGVTAEQYKFSLLSGFRRDVPESPNQWYLNTGTPDGSSNTNSGDKWTRHSYISRLNYSYDGRYLLTATFRADGSSRFGSNNRWAYVPSVGVGWNITSEDFMANQDVFSNLKLRGSYGSVGNDAIPTSLYYSLATLNVPYYYGTTSALGVAFEQASDPNIKWEVMQEFDFGVEFTTFNKRLSGEIDYYNKKTTDALVEVNLPRIVGDDKYITNAANFRNSGVELTLNWSDNINKDWDYTIGGNVAYNKNEIIGLNGGQALFDGSVAGVFTTKSDNGQPIGSFFLLQDDGIFQTQAEIDASAQKDARPGDLRYRDVSGPDGKPDGVISDLDRVYHGAYIPKVTYGFNIGVNYREFDFSLNAYGTAGGKIYNGKKATRGADARDNLEAYEAKNRWTPNNTNTPIPRAHTNQLPASTWFLEKGDFLRLNNLTIGYTIPKKTLEKYHISNLRVYLTGQNLITITSYSGFTPELLPGGDRPTLGAGIELGSYPTIRTFAFGVNLSF